MNIAVDVMGSDRGAAELARGAALASAEGGFGVTLFGDEKVIRQATEGIEKADVAIVGCDCTIEMCDRAVSVIKEKSKSSMAAALRAAADGECDAVVSSGNSGALITGATFIVKRINGVKRPAFAPILPTAKGAVMLLDAGANVEVRPEFLCQFGQMGAVYMEKVCGASSPRVGLICNGKEDSKGTDLTREAKALLSESGCNFGGYMEGSELMSGEWQVAVTDGFTGNVLLKTLEGMGHFVSGRIKHMMTSSPLRLLGSFFMLRGIKKFKKEFDSKQYGGAIILGVKAPVIKAHGSADAVAFGVAVRQAADAASKNVCGTISDCFAAKKEE